MNKYYTFFSILFLLLGELALIHAQEVQISKPVDAPNGAEYKLISRFQQQVLLYKNTESKFYIQSFSDGDLEENWTKTIEFEKKDISILEIVAHKKSFSILYYFLKKGDTHIRCKEFSTEAEEINNFDIGIIHQPIHINKHQLISSKNKEHFSLYFPHKNNLVEIIHFDFAHQKQHWQQKLSFSDFNFYRDFQQIVLNNSGDFFFVINNNNNKRKRNQHHFTICKFGTNKASTSFKIPFHGYISYDINIQYDEVNGQLVAAGLYSTENHLANGIFYFNTNLKNETVIRTTSLGEQFMRSLTGKKRKKILGIDNFNICKLVLRKDGGVLMVAEQRFAYQASAFAYQEEQPKLQADYLYENLLVASIHPSGDVYWKEVLYKSQSSENDDARYSSFFAVTTNSNIRFLYNNSISWDTSIFEYVINSKGQIERNVVAHQEKKSGILPQLTSSIQVSASEVIAVSERDEKIRLLKINY